MENAASNTRVFKLPLKEGRKTLKIHISGVAARNSLRFIRAQREERVDEDGNRGDDDGALGGRCGGGAGNEVENTHRQEKPAPS